jgi:hypothetical protein
MDEQSTINEALETCLGSYPSQRTREKIAAHYGEAIARKVESLCGDAISCPVDWRMATIDTALPALHELLTNKYPWLSDQVRVKIVSAFVMAWKYRAFRLPSYVALSQRRNTYEETLFHAESCRADASYFSLGPKGGGRL